MGDLGPQVIVAAALLLVGVGVGLLLLARRYRQVDGSGALIVTSSVGPRVTFTGALVLPVVHRAERLDLAVRPVTIERRGAAGIVGRDGLRVDIQATFLLRVNRTVADVLRVAETIGCARASDPAALREIFADKLVDALRSVVGRLDSAELGARREELPDELAAAVGDDLHGFVLDEVTVDAIEPTPRTARRDPTAAGDLHPRAAKAAPAALNPEG